MFEFYESHKYLQNHGFLDKSYNSCSVVSHLMPFPSRPLKRETLLKGIVVCNSKLSRYDSDQLARIPDASEP